jgi:hypothetical protein
MYMELKKLHSQKINDPMKKWINKVNRTFSKEVQMAIKTHEEMLNIPGCKGNANKKQVRFHLTPVGMATIKNTKNNICWEQYMKKGILIHYWWQCNLVQSLLKTVWRLLKKLKTEVSYDPAIPLLGIHL